MTARRGAECGDGYAGAMVNGREQVSGGHDHAHSTPRVSVRMRSAMPGLTPAERKIARAILASYPLAGLEPIADLAGAAGVSAPSVVRFARTLGFDGYRGLQERSRSR